MNTTKSQCVLVTGAARSGKSEWAEALAHQAEQQGQQIIYVATSVADATDTEWQARLEQHRHRRPAQWGCVEGPVDLVATITETPSQTCLLIDSLGTWLAHVLDQDDAAWEALLHQLLSAVQGASGTLIFVAEEVGWGVVPAYPVGRTFRDRLGQLTRQLGAIAHPVYLVTGGHVLNLSALGTVLPPPGTVLPSDSMRPPIQTQTCNDRPESCSS